MAYKDFTAGSVLTADELDTYLMRQSVMRFATASARDTALSAVLAEGQIAYIDNKDRLEFYDGTEWNVMCGRVGGRWSRAANQSATNGALTLISWDTETTDTDGFLTPTATDLTIPTGLTGYYAVTARLIGSTAWAAADSYIRINVDGINYDYTRPASNSTQLTATVMAYAPAASVISVGVFNTDATKTVTGTLQLQMLSS